eukprot:6441758-Prymnesium_polylepis.1
MRARTLALGGWMDGAGRRHVGWLHVGARRCDARRRRRRVLRGTTGKALVTYGEGGVWEVDETSPGWAAVAARQPQKRA